MLKYIFPVMGVAITGYSAANAMLGSRSAGSRPAPMNVEQTLAEFAERENKKKGKVQGHSTFEGVEQRGRNLTFEYSVNLDPRTVNTAAASNELRGKMKGEACKGPFAEALKQGAVLDFNYRTPRTNVFLFNVRIDASICAA